MDRGFCIYPEDLELLEVMRRIQFIEIKATGLDLRKHTIKVPQRLVDIINQNTNGRRKFTTSFSLYSSDDVIINMADDIKASIIDLRRERSFYLEDYGSVCLVNDKEIIAVKEAAIDEQIKLFTDELRRRIKVIIEEASMEVAQYLLPIVLQGRGYPSPGKEQTLIDIKDDVKEGFGDIEQYLANIGLKITYKNLTNELLHDDLFMSRVLYRNDLFRALDGLPLINRYPKEKAVMRSDYEYL